MEFVTQILTFTTALLSLLFTISELLGWRKKGPNSVSEALMEGTHMAVETMSTRGTLSRYKRTPYHSPDNSINNSVEEIPL